MPLLRGYVSHRDSVVGIQKSVSVLRPLFQIQICKVNIPTIPPSFELSNYEGPLVCKACQKRVRAAKVTSLPEVYLCNVCFGLGAGVRCIKHECPFRAVICCCIPFQRFS
ncbi:hypothetical protein ALP8811_02024 [Aliiroseovarius pelagivivens]|uniref:Uncharacterized protein n=1 Tax=Aliiroseovarius pelagivivens TaxID=1639690 RepID=A0A2R8ALT7_9RHOB|nr:hypothetical protein ALP8811_02024 [Aliiroseovarius pelagivivens]